jgi:hypothetical protein
MNLVWSFVGEEIYSVPYQNSCVTKPASLPVGTGSCFARCSDKCLPPFDNEEKKKQTLYPQEGQGSYWIVDPVLFPLS